MTFRDGIGIRYVSLAFVGLFVLGLSLVWGIRDPFWIYKPRFGNALEWRWMYGLAIAYRASAIMICLAIMYQTDVKVMRKIAKILVCASVGAAMLSVVNYAAGLQSLWKADTVGRYILEFYPEYFRAELIRQGWTHASFVLSAGVVGSLWWLLAICSKERLATKEHVWIAAMWGIIMGPYLIWGAILGGFLLSVVLSLWNKPLKVEVIKPITLMVCLILFWI